MPPPENTPAPDHGAGCDCGLDVTAVGRLFDAEALARHVGLSRGSIRSAASRVAAGAAAPPWWREPYGHVGSSAVWTLAAAEEMRRAAVSNPPTRGRPPSK
ncbi:MAG: hypothetical protein Q8Q02_16820 [Nocardioides sp.]|nr:hypothetical protein [Nocardioides sp.]